MREVVVLRLGERRDLCLQSLQSLQSRQSLQSL